MPLRLEIKRQLQARSDRVKCVDVHPKEPWVLSALYSGHVFIWNFENENLEKSFEVSQVPVRCAKFIARKQWIVCGSDDMHIRIYNYNTMERVTTFEAHQDYIRSIAVHPTLPYVLSASDDMSIKLWDWEKGWENTVIFEGHTHYVMQVEINPKDPNTFATASLDRTVKVWGLNTSTPHFSLEGHERGVNCVSYFAGGDRPFLVSGADDHLVKIWDYQTKSCVATLEAHTNNVSAVCFHPQLPLVISGSEDGTLRVWQSTTYRLENTLNYGMERVWTIGCVPGSNKVAIGYDEGTIMIKLGQEEPVVSMDKSGKVVWAKNHEIQGSNVRSTGNIEINDGDVLSLPTKDLGSCEIYPQTLMHNPNGRLLAVCGDGEYTIYTARALKNKTFGNALEFVWASDPKIHATRESSSKLKIYKDYKEHKNFRPSFPAEGIFGGYLLGVRSTEFIDFYDWETTKIVRRIEICPLKVFWSESGELVVLVCEDAYYVLRYNEPIVRKFFDQDVETDEQGIDAAFDFEQEVSERAQTGQFVGDCFIYTNSAGRLNYFVGGEVMTLAHLDRPAYLLGYLPKDNRVYLIDKQYQIFSYQLLLHVLAYQAAIVRRDFEAAEDALPSIPKEYRNRLARFLEAQDLKDMALEISTDPEHQFELCLQLEKLDMAREVLMKSETEQKWKQLGDLALAQFDLPLAEECLLRAKDLGGLLLLYSSKGDKKGIENLVELSKEKGRYNVTFMCLFLLHRVKDCLDLLCDIGRIPEAAFMARTYAPSETARIVKLWKEDLRKVSTNAADSLASPEIQPHMFERFDSALGVEQWQKQHGVENLFSAGDYMLHSKDHRRDLLGELESGGIDEMKHIYNDESTAVPADISGGGDVGDLGDISALQQHEENIYDESPVQQVVDVEDDEERRTDDPTDLPSLEPHDLPELEVQPKADDERKVVDTKVESPLASVDNSANVSSDDFDVDELGISDDDVASQNTPQGDEKPVDLEELDQTLGDLDFGDDEF